MKALTKISLTNFLSISLIVLVGSTAHAAIMGGWEKPVFKAKMDVVSSRPEMANVKHVELIMTQQDGRGTSTGFVLLIDDQPMNFTVLNRTQDLCGASVFAGRPMKSRRDLDIRDLQLVVLDRRNAHCVPRPGNTYHALPVSYPWEAVLQESGQEMMRLTGTPEAMVSVQ